MAAERDLSEVPLEHLVAEEAAIRSRRYLTALLIGALAGVAVYAAVHGRFLLTVGLFLVAGWIAKRNAQRLARLQLEIGRRSTAG